MKKKELIAEIDKKNVNEGSQFKGGSIPTSKLIAESERVASAKEAEENTVIQDVIEKYVDGGFSADYPLPSKYGVNSVSDLQSRLGADGPDDLIKVCRNILSADQARSGDGKDYRGETIANLDELPKILSSGLELSEKDPDFDLKQFSVDPDAALAAIRANKEIESMA